MHNCLLLLATCIQYLFELYLLTFITAHIAMVTDYIEAWLIQAVTDS